VNDGHDGRYATFGADSKVVYLILTMAFMTWRSTARATVGFVKVTGTGWYYAKGRRARRMILRISPDA